MDIKILEKIDGLLLGEKFLNSRDEILDYIRSNRNIAFYFFEKILSNPPKRLEQAEFLLREMVDSKNFFQLTNLLEKSIGEENNLFIVRFITDNYVDFVGESREGLFQESALDIVKKIIQTDLSHAEEVFILVKKILELRGSTYNEKKSSNREKEHLADLILVLSQDETRIEELVTLVSEFFDISEDGYGMFMDTPSTIYSLLLKYINGDFDTRFFRVVNLIVENYQRNYDSEFKGWDWSGSGVSRFGDHFSLSDRNFVVHVLAPALKEKNDFNFVKDNCIFDENIVSAQNPDFLNRASIPTLLQRYSNPDKINSSEAYLILENFILSEKGLPRKADLIYQVLNEYNLDQQKKWALVRLDAEEVDIPASVFLDQAIIQLAADGHVEAKRILDKWQQNSEYYNRFTFSGSVTKAISSKLDSNFEAALTLFTDFIKKDGFTTDKFDFFEVYDLARILSRVLEKDTEAGLQVLNGLAQKKQLGKNEQILLTNAISNIDVKNEVGKKAVLEIYEKFVNPLLGTYGSSREIKAKLIGDDNPREQFVKFADLLAEVGEIEKALRIVKAFIEDEDPYLPDVDPSGGEYNEHKRIDSGEGEVAITSVRGWCAWVLMKCTILKGRPYIDEIIKLTEQLVKDNNYYVQQMACFSLSQLAQARLSHLPDSKELFFDHDRVIALEKAKKIEDVAFELLKKVTTYSDGAQKSLVKSILSVFNNIRSLNQTKAHEFVSLLLKLTPEAIAECTHILIFFAEFREKTYKEWEWKEKGLYDDLENFDPEPFREIIYDLIKKDLAVRRAFTFKFSLLPEENKATEEQVFHISLGYLNKITDLPFDDQINRSIYTYFIGRHIDKHFKECYELWRKCIVSEVKTLNENLDKQIPNSVPNWLESEHGKVLLIVKEKLGDEQFLEDLDIFMGLPQGVNFYGIGDAIHTLLSFPSSSEMVGLIYDKLIERDPRYFDTKKEWSSKNP